ncbi:MAG TPA: formate dehydrogenase subunit gamma [Candidatus Binataceae bacterium]|nr:formate dehydrogenase subunit gamma [Candidatus Binataceae bacterium]
MPNPRAYESETVLAIATGLKAERGALMLVLHEVHRRLGFIPRESVADIAQVLNLSQAEVHGVISFYRDFRWTPPGRHRIQVCRAESCQAMGAVDLAAHVSKRLGIGFGETSDDRGFTLEPAYCLGNCGCSPAIVIDGQIHGRVSTAGFDEMLARLRKG